MSTSYMPTATEILINATRISEQAKPDLYEFVLNETLHVIECARVESLAGGVVQPINQFLTTLQGVLFELNHVRVNPRLDNRFIIGRLTKALADIGVDVYNTPFPESMSVCYRPLGEITENVRFYFNEGGGCVFLCPKAKLRVVPPVSKRKFG